MLGFKTEFDTASIHTIHGGRTEFRGGILNLYHYGHRHRFCLNPLTTYR
ncbi:MAG: hypothetical protein AAF800_13580 [Planctomycetota bacterium]